MKFVSWLDSQIMWIKSFLSESPNGDGTQKGSSKRIAAITVIAVFALTYLRVAADADIIPDIPEGWRWLLFIVLGVTGLADGIKTWMNRNGNKTS